MVQGATSDAGKSILVAGLCRVLARRGCSVAPFKPQNMALNSAVTTDGGEIGRAQALQAQACFLEPHTDMNPVLLKPSSDTGAQVIIHGQAVNHQDAREYHAYKQTAMRAVLDSYQRLSAAYDYVIVEGAGSPAEINLRENDIANMGFAEAVDCPVLLVADIDRGGVFAHLVGTLALLSSSEQARVLGFVINKFRGDIALLEPGNVWLAEHTQKPVIGVLPFLQGLHLDAEDAVSAQQVLTREESHLRVVVPVFSRISNHTDFDALRLHPQVDLQFVGPGQTPPGADLIILPGSKNVRGDLQWLRDNGWETALQKHLRYGGKLLGICGGYQMLGREVADPQGVESAAGTSQGLALLSLSTVLEPQKQLRRVSGHLLLDAVGNPAWAAGNGSPPVAECEAGVPVSGYEIHCGVTQLDAGVRPFCELTGAIPEGAISDDGQIAGTYLHGVFDLPQARDAVLRWAGLSVEPQPGVDRIREQQLERLADTLEAHLDLAALFPEIFAHGV